MTARDSTLDKLYAYFLAQNFSPEVSQALIRHHVDDLSRLASALSLVAKPLSTRASDPTFAAFAIPPAQLKPASEALSDLNKSIGAVTFHIVATSPIGCFFEIKGHVDFTPETTNVAMSNGTARLPPLGRLIGLNHDGRIDHNVPRGLDTTGLSNLSTIIRNRGENLITVDSVCYRSATMANFLGQFGTSNIDGTIIHKQKPPAVFAVQSNPHASAWLAANYNRYVATVQRNNLTEISTRRLKPAAGVDLIEFLHDQTLLARIRPLSRINPNANPGRSIAPDDLKPGLIFRLAFNEGGSSMAFDNVTKALYTETLAANSPAAIFSAWTSQATSPVQLHFYQGLYGVPTNILFAIGIVKHARQLECTMIVVEREILGIQIQHLLTHIESPIQLRVIGAKHTDLVPVTSTQIPALAAEQSLYIFGVGAFPHFENDVARKLVWCEPNIDATISLGSNFMRFAERHVISSVEINPYLYNPSGVWVFAGPWAVKTPIQQFDRMKRQNVVATVARVVRTFAHRVAASLFLADAIQLHVARSPWKTAFFNDQFEHLTHLLNIHARQVKMSTRAISYFEGQIDIDAEVEARVGVLGIDDLPVMGAPITGLGAAPTLEPEYVMGMEDIPAPVAATPRGPPRRNGLPAAREMPMMGDYELRGPSVRGAPAPTPVVGGSFAPLPSVSDASSESSSVAPTEEISGDSLSLGMEESVVTATYPAMPGEDKGGAVEGPHPEETAPMETSPTSPPPVRGVRERSQSPVGPSKKTRQT